MNFLVTGGTGFIGKRVVGLLIKKGVNVVSTDIDVKNNKDQFKEWIDVNK